MGAAGPRMPRRRSRPPSPREAAPSADPDERVRQLEARLAEFKASERKLATERDILRKAAKYVVGEANW
ncbi:hypothetical protein ACW4TU_44415 [Streptomyces sp. QTS52]